MIRLLGCYSFSLNSLEEVKSNVHKFKPLRGGLRFINGSYNAINQRSNFWTSTSINNDMAHFFTYAGDGILSFFNDQIADKSCGFYVRYVIEPNKLEIIKKSIAAVEEFENQLRETLTFRNSIYTDIDTIATYKTIKIGSQIWMGANLNVESFNNGDKLLYTQTPEEWIKAAKGGIPACCDYNNDIANGNKFGKLYNWHAVFDKRGLCPKSWRIPSKNEFEIMLHFVKGHSDSAFKAILEGGYSGFNALFSGYCDDIGNFYELDYTGNWWTSFKYEESIAWILYISKFSKSAIVKDTFKEFGFAVRCLKE